LKEAIILKHPERSSRAVLLFHGLTGAPSELASLAKSLYRAGYDVFCPVLPGHCEGAKALKKTSWQDWHKAALASYDELKDQEGYREVYVSGLCLGAVLALGVASERESASGVAALSTTLFFDGWSIPWFSFIMPIVIYSVMKFFYAYPEEGAMGVKNTEVRAKVQKALEKKDEFMDCFPIMCVLQLKLYSRFIRKQLHRVKVPVILIHSRTDDLASKRSSDTVYQSISSTRKEYILLEDSYHLIVIDNEKELVFQKTLEFIKGC
jgi:carboxylesterase